MAILQSDHILRTVLRGSPRSTCLRRYFTFGALQITSFNATGIIISWDLICDFVQSMEMRTGMGMVGKYSAFFLDRSTGDMIFVQLAWVIPPAVVA